MGQGHDARPLRREVSLPDRSARRWAANLVDLMVLISALSSTLSVQSAAAAAWWSRSCSLIGKRPGTAIRRGMPGCASAGGVGLERWRVPAGTDMSTSVAQAAQPQGPGSACRTCLACQTRCALVVLSDQGTTRRGNATGSPLRRQRPTATRLAATRSRRLQPRDLAYGSGAAGPEFDEAVAPWLRCSRRGLLRARRPDCLLSAYASSHQRCRASVSG